MEAKDVKKIVRKSYAKVARKGSSCCGGDAKAENISKAIGYTKLELDSIPEEAILGLGCGNPTAIASLQEGEIVVEDEGDGEGDGETFEEGGEMIVEEESGGEGDGETFEEEIDWG